ncbi:MAG: hypothetical protein ACLST1_07650 [[Eubacterium] siraeum]
MKNRRRRVKLILTEERQFSEMLLSSVENFADAMHIDTDESNAVMAPRHDGRSNP